MGNSVKGLGTCKLQQYCFDFPVSWSMQETLGFLRSDRLVTYVRRISYCSHFIKKSVDFFVLLSGECLAITVRVSLHLYFSLIKIITSLLLPNKNNNHSLQNICAKKNTSLRHPPFGLLSFSVNWNVFISIGCWRSPFWFLWMSWCQALCWALGLQGTAYWTDCESSFVSQQSLWVIPCTHPAPRIVPTTNLQETNHKM